MTLYLYEKCILVGNHFIIINWFNTNLLFHSIIIKFKNYVFKIHLNITPNEVLLSFAVGIPQPLIHGGPRWINYILVKIYSHYFRDCKKTRKYFRRKRIEFYKNPKGNITEDHIFLFIYYWLFKSCQIESILTHVYVQTRCIK